MNLQQLFLAVKEENLDKWTLENYHKEMSEIKADKLIHLADIEKERAIFMLKDLEKPTSTKTREWKGTESGLEEITLKAEIKAIATHLRSLQSRLYSNY